jgi:hypothetical protein
MTSIKRIIFVGNLSRQPDLKLIASVRFSGPHEGGGAKP